MRISTRGRYALRLMLDLATNYTGKPDPPEGCGEAPGDLR
mgnify:CR=1 FL=1